MIWSSFKPIWLLPAKAHSVGEDSTQELFQLIKDYKFAKHSW